MIDCVICRNGARKPGAATVTLARGSTTLVVRSVPAQVCDNCGEEYIDADVTRRLLELAEQAVAAGVQVDVREYRAA